MRSLIKLFIIKPNDFINFVKETSNTSISRERYIDLLKVVSIFAVVYSTTLFLSLESSGSEVLIHNSSSSDINMSIASWYLNGLVVFFFCNGFSNSIAWYSNIGRDGSVWEFLANRINSILGPMIMLIIFGTIMIHYSITNKLIPEYLVTANDNLHPITEFLLWPLWLVSIYLVVLMFSPVTAYFHKKNSLLFMLTLFSAFVFIDLFTFTQNTDYIKYINYLIFWLFIHQIGYFYADGTLQDIKLPFYFILSTVSYLILYLITSGNQVIASVSNFRLSLITNEDPPTILMLLSGLGLLSLVLIFRNPLEKVMNNQSVWYVISFLNSHLYTIFLWHTFSFLFIYFFDLPLSTLILSFILFFLIIGSPERNTFRLSSSLVKRLSPEQPWPLPIRARFSLNNVALSWYGSFLILLSTIQITLGGVGTFGFLVDRQLFFFNGNTFEAFLRLTTGMILLNITIRSKKFRNISLSATSLLLMVLLLYRFYYQLSIHQLEFMFTIFGVALCFYSIYANRNNSTSKRVISK